MCRQLLGPRPCRLGLRGGVNVLQVSCGTVIGFEHSDPIIIIINYFVVKLNVNLLDASVHR